MKTLINAHRMNSLTTLCDKLGIQFNNYELLQQALIHTSYANEAKAAPSINHNERLEFLGDAVLDLVISEFLFRRYPNLPEGELTKARALIVCEPTLGRSAASLGIGEYLLLGKGEALSGGRERLSILADAFEAIIGAIYLDSDFHVAANFILNHLQADLTLVERGDYVKDYKTLLQEVVQKKSDSKIIYQVLLERGPDHNKVFEIAVFVNANNLGIGIGKSKKEAEQQAAKQALIKLNVINN